MDGDGSGKHRGALVLRWAAFLPLAFVGGAFVRIMLFEGTWSVYEIMGVDPFAFAPLTLVNGVPYAQ